MSETALRVLEPSDLPRALELVRPELPELELTEEDLGRNLLEDPESSRDLLLAAHDGGALVGVACAVRRGVSGHIKLLVVAPSRRKRGIGGTLLGEIERRLFSLGATSVETDGAAPVYLLPGLPERCLEGRRFLEARGYRAVATRSSMTAELLKASLNSVELEERLARRGIEVRRATAGDAEMLLARIEGDFSRDWAVEVAFSLGRSRPGTHIALADGRLAGFASAGLWARNAFGPMATTPGFEGQGIGEVLLRRCLADLRAAGVERAVIPWVGPTDFYRAKVGAALTLPYTLLQKPGSAP
jgi:mycothiol synthase